MTQVTTQTRPFPCLELLAHVKVRMLERKVRRQQYASSQRPHQGYSALTVTLHSQLWINLHKPDFWFFGWQGPCLLHLRILRPWYYNAWHIGSLNNCLLSEAVILEKMPFLWWPDFNDFVYTLPLPKLTDINIALISLIHDARSQELDLPLGWTFLTIS